MGPFPSLIKLQLGPSHETRLSLSPYYVPPDFCLFSVGRHFSDQAGIELLHTPTDLLSDNRGIRVPGSTTQYSNLHLS